MKLFFEDASEMNFEGISYDSDKTVEKDHGRIETCEYRITSDIDWLYDREKWKGMNSIGIRHIALNLLRHEQTLKKGIAVKRHRARWDNDYLLKVLKAV